MMNEEEKEKIRKQVVRAEVRKEEKLRKARQQLNERLGDKPIVVKGHNWTLTIDEYTEQEKWRRDIPGVGNVAGAEDSKCY